MSTELTQQEQGATLPGPRALRSRRAARTVALQALYELDLVHRHDPQEVVHRLLEGSNLAPSSSRFAHELVTGVMDNLPRIDEILVENAPLWPLAQIATIDRNVLRLAIFEILFDNKVPKRAAINEAVELAKTFGSDSSGRFVNGVLGQITQREL